MPRRRFRQRRDAQTLSRFLNRRRGTTRCWSRADLGHTRPVADQAIVDWVFRASEHARRTVSVCTGAYLLAAAGLLNNRR